ncbi:kelch-like protein 25 [Oculina patagonica]
MEDLQPISAAEQAAFCVELTKRLNMERKQDHLCDITLVTKDDKEFKAHRNVLSAASPFFHKLLQSDMKENREGIARFEEISGSVMEDVLEFIYTGSVEITQENSKDLIATGNYLLIPGLKTVSGRFLEGQMTKSNCISTFYFAEKYQCDELIANSRKFIHANFASQVAEMDEFLNLEAKEVERWISDDEISVPDEIDVFRIILKWVKHDKSNRKAAFEELFRHVQLVFLSRDYLFDVVTNELVQENSRCLRLTSDAMKLTSFKNENDFSQSPRKGIETRAIVACGGKYTFCYLPEKDEWKRLPDGLLENRSCYTQMINFRDQLYTFHYCKAERYDPVFYSWSTLNSLTVSRGSAIVTVVSGEIYAMEVDTFRTKKSTIARYDVERCSWQTVLSSHEGCREEAFVVAAGNHLYVFGGKPPQTREYVAKVERFDTVENKWENIADMQQARGCAFGVATQGKIYVAGGKQDEEYYASWLTACEMYNISTNEWQSIASLNVNREHGSMVCLKGTLYVLGGACDFPSRNDLSVECYDATEDKWIKKTTIPVKTISEENKDTFTGCALKLSKGVLDKARVVKLKE